MPTRLLRQKRRIPGQDAVEVVIATGEEGHGVEGVDIAMRDRKWRGDRIVRTGISDFTFQLYPSTLSFMNTRLTYLYRDASNYKQWHDVVLAVSV